MGLFFNKKKDSKEALKDMLEGFELPSFSQILTNVLALLRDPDSSLAEIAKEVNRDPSLVMSIFKMVNSAAMGLRRQVVDINQAVSLLGRARLESIVLTLAVRGAQPAIFVPWFDTKHFWQTSAKRATLARHLAERLHPVSATHAFTAGMLQDMGIPILAASLSSKYVKVAEILSKENLSIVEVEKDLLSFDHQMVGELMAMEWNLPEELTLSISGHHDENKVQPAVSLVSLIRNEDIDSSVQDLIMRCGEGYEILNDETQQMVASAFDEAGAISA